MLDRPSIIRVGYPAGNAGAFALCAADKSIRLASMCVVQTDPDALHDARNAAGKSKAEAMLVFARHRLPEGCLAWRLR